MRGDLPAIRGDLIKAPPLQAERDRETCTPLGMEACLNVAFTVFAHSGGVRLAGSGRQRAFRQSFVTTFHAAVVLGDFRCGNGLAGFICFRAGALPAGCTCVGFHAANLRALRPRRYGQISRSPLGAGARSRSFPQRSAADPADRQQRPQPEIPKPQPAPQHHRDVNGKEGVAEKRVIDAHVGRDCPAQVAGEQDGTEKSSTRHEIQRQADQQRDAEPENARNGKAKLQGALEHRCWLHELHQTIDGQKSYWNAAENPPCDHAAAAGGNTRRSGRHVGGRSCSDDVGGEH
jgi:hypothetical protein